AGAESAGTKGEANSSADEVVSLTIRQRSDPQSFRSASASLLRKIMKPSGSKATTKSSPSRRIATCRRYSIRWSPVHGIERGGARIVPGGDGTARKRHRFGGGMGRNPRNAGPKAG